VPLDLVNRASGASGRGSCPYLSVMRRTLYPRRGLLSVGVLLAAVAMPVMPQESTDADRHREWHFQVMLDGKPIGEHDFTLSGTDDAREVETRAHFVVTVLRVPVYRYDHVDHERWRGGCLAQIDATTNDNGDRMRVQGTLGAGGLGVSGPHGASTWTGCVHTFAYWDRRMLTQQRLLNAQTGEYEPVRVTRDQDAGAVPGATEHWRVDGSHLHIELWYSATGQWRALQSRLEQGKTLRYELRS
jgi:hypothetical protein